MCTPPLWLLNYSSNGPQEFEFLKNLLLGERKGSQRRNLSSEERFHTVLTACHVTLQESLELRNGQVVTGVGPHPGQDCQAMPTLCAYLNLSVIWSSWRRTPRGMSLVLFVPLSVATGNTFHFSSFSLLIVFLFGFLRMGFWPWLVRTPRTHVLTPTTELMIGTTHFIGYPES